MNVLWSSVFESFNLVKTKHSIPPVSRDSSCIHVNINIAVWGVKKTCLQNIIVKAYDIESNKNIIIL